MTGETVGWNVKPNFM